MSYVCGGAVVVEYLLFAVPDVCRGCVLPLFCKAVLTVLSSFAIISPRKTLLYLCSCCPVTVIVLCLFRAFCLWCVNVACPGHTHWHFHMVCSHEYNLI